MEHRTILLPAGYDPNSLDGSNMSRRIFLRGVGIACLGFAPFLQACDNAFSSGEKGSGMARKGPAPQGMRPPIDATVPAKIETATFSLG